MATPCTNNRVVGNGAKSQAGMLFLECGNSGTFQERLSKLKKQNGGKWNAQELPCGPVRIRLAPSEMKELSEQLQELSDKDFIRPSSHLGEPRSCASGQFWALPEGSEELKCMKKTILTHDLELGLGSFCSLAMRTLPIRTRSPCHDPRACNLFFDQKESYMRHDVLVLVLLSDHDCDIRYHPGKANVVADALSHKEREVPLRVRALVMTISLDLPRQILAAQIEALKPENLKKEDVGGMIRTDIPKERLEPRADGALCSKWHGAG
ncbi:hypothetical protein Tco_0508910 [Tanacetum coccineum]